MGWKKSSRLGRKVKQVRTNGRETSQMFRKEDEKAEETEGA